MRGVKVITGAAVSVLLLACMGPMPALADTIEAALVRAYQNNPQLNSQRAQVRFTDENVPQALSGYRPKVAITASAGTQYTDTLSNAGGTANQLVSTPIHGVNAPRSVVVAYCLGVVITFVGGSMVPKPFQEMIDPKTKKMRTRLVDTSDETYEVARRYMIRLEQSDLDDSARLERLAGVVKLSPADFRKRFEYVVR